MDRRKTSLQTLIGLPIVLALAGGIGFAADRLYDSLASTAPSTLTADENTSVDSENSNVVATNRASTSDPSEYTILHGLLVEQLTAFRPTSSAHEITAAIHIAVLCEFVDAPAGLDHLPFGSLRNEWTDMVTLFKENDARTTVCPYVPQSDRSTAELHIQQDLDNDGLPVWAEAWYGTSETSGDSDGDGFSDPEELANNFNPLGPGERTGL